MVPVKMPQLYIAGMACQGAIVVARGRPTLVWCVAPVGCHSGWPADGPSRYGTIPGDPDRVGEWAVSADLRHGSRCCAALTAPRHLLTQLDRREPACLLVCAPPSCDFAGATIEYRDLTRPRAQLLDHSAQRGDHGRHELSFRRLLSGHGQAACTGNGVVFAEQGEEPCPVHGGDGMTSCPRCTHLREAKMPTELGRHKTRSLET